MACVQLRRAPPAKRAAMCAPVRRAEWKHLGDSIKAAMIFARAHLVNPRKCSVAALRGLERFCSLLVLVCKVLAQLTPLPSLWTKRCSFHPIPVSIRCCMPSIYSFCSSVSSPACRATRLAYSASKPKSISIQGPPRLVI